MTNAEKKAGLLSSRLYNEALDRAQIHDLTGAAEKLRISLQFNQKNIPARNLYGLVLYERGEAGEALHQWILSQNLLPAGNPASYYIQNVQKDTARIRQMNRGVSDYNEALRNCQEGNEDVGALRLRRSVQKNPKLVDAFVLLALIDIKEKRFNHARRMLLRALRIDRYHPDAMRYLQEVREQTGAAGARTASEEEVTDIVAPAAGKEGRRLPVRNIFRVGNNFSPAVNIIFGVAVGLLAACFLIVPGVRASAVKNSSDRIVESTTTIDSQNSKIDELQSSLDAKDKEISDAQDAEKKAKTAADSAEHLLKAMQASEGQDYTTALQEIDQVDESLLTADEKTIYDALSGSLSGQAYDIYVSLGQTAYYQEDWKTAAENLEKAVALTPDDYDSYVLLVYCYQHLNDQDKELETWKKIATQFAGSQEGDYAQSQADALEQQSGGSTDDTSSGAATDETASDGSGTDGTAGTGTNGTTGTDANGTAGTGTGRTAAAGGTADTGTAG